MAKKPNQSEENLLSKRLKKTDHGDKKGRYSQQAEINIFVPNNEVQNNPPAYQDNQSFVPQYEDPNQQQGFVSNNSEQFNQQSMQEQPMYVEPTFDIPSEQRQQHTGGNSFRDRFQKSEQLQTPNVQEYTFPADGENAVHSEEMQFDNRYADMFRNKKKKSIEKPKDEHQIGEHALNGKNGNPFKKSLSQKTKLIILIASIAAILIIPQLIFRIPALIDTKDSLALELNLKGQQTILDYIKVQNGVGDWDKDGILNANDKDVFDPDTDKNGIPDGEADKDFLQIGSVIKYENVTLEAQNRKMGVSKFRNYYVFKNYKGWVKISDETGIPYIYKSNGWTEAKYSIENGDYMVEIPCDCYIEFVPKGTKIVYRTDLFGDKTFASEESRYVKSYGGFAPIASFFYKLLLPVTEPKDATIASIWYSDTYHIVQQNNINKAEAIKPDSSNYKLTALNDYEFTYDKLQKIYDNIDNKKTTLISIVREDGSEAICFAYAYDYLGNIYVADAVTSKTAGIIKINPMSQVYHKDGQNYIREWYEFEGLGFSSDDGDKMFVF